MVLADSNGISRAPSYLGYFHKAAERISTTGLSPSTVRHSNRFAYTPAPHFTSPAELIRKVPQPRPCNARRLSHMARFSPIRVRSPLLTESLLFSLPVGTEMFHFPTFPPHILYIQMRVTTWSCNRWRGSPIRTPSDQSLVINSPRLIADSYVLLRLLMPRHPPCALKNLTTNMIKIITSAKTLQSKESRKHTTLKELCAPRFIIIRNCFAKQTNQPTTPKELSVNPVSQDARVHYTVPKQQPHHTHHQHTPQRGNVPA